MICFSPGWFACYGINPLMPTVNVVAWSLVVFIETLKHQYCHAYYSITILTSCFEVFKSYSSCWVLCLALRVCQNGFTFQGQDLAASSFDETQQPPTNYNFFVKQMLLPKVTYNWKSRVRKPLEQWHRSAGSGVWTGNLPNWGMIS